jgi:hypothetical protein
VDGHLIWCSCRCEQANYLNYFNLIVINATRWPHCFWQCAGIVARLWNLYSKTLQRFIGRYNRFLKKMHDLNRAVMNAMTGHWSGGKFVLATGLHSCNTYTAARCSTKTSPNGEMRVHNARDECTLSNSQDKNRRKPFVRVAAYLLTILNNHHHAPPPCDQTKTKIACSKWFGRLLSGRNRWMVFLQVCKMSVHALLQDAAHQCKWLDGFENFL